MKIRLYARTRFIGSEDERTIEVDDGEWADMSVMEREAYMLDAFWDSEIVEWGYDEQPSK
jgi:hypothetical protein